MGGVSLAQDVTLDFTQNTWKLPTDYTKTAANYTDGTYKISFGKSSNGHKFGGSYLIFGKSGATLSLPAFDFDVEKIVVTGNKNASASVKQNIFVGDEAASTETTGAQGTNTYEIAEAYQAAGNIYTLKVLNDKNTQVTKIEIYKKGGATKTSTTVSFGENYDGKTISLKPGDSFKAPTATLTPAEAGSLTYSSSDEKVATVDATGAVTLTGTTGKTTITAAFEGNDTYAASKASYTLNVAEALSLTGDGSKENPYTVADALAIVNASQQTSGNVYVKGIVSSVDKYYDKYHQIDYYIVDKEGDAEKIMAYNGKGLNKADFSSINDLKVGDKVIVLGTLTKYNNIVELKRNNYIVEFWGENTKKETSVSFGADYDGKTFSLKPGESFKAPTATLTPAEAGKLTYSSSDETVATVDAEGKVTLTGTTGKTTIKAEFAGNDTYAPSSASYTLNVAEALSLTGDGTKANPYTVADVLAIVNAGQQTTDNVYVKGIVSSIKTTADNIVKYKNCDYYLVDNEGDENNIMAFRGKYLGNTDFTSADQLKVGNKVIVLGVLTKYYDIVELANGNYIVEFWGEQAPTDVTLNVDETGYATLYYSDRALTVPANTKATTYKVVANNLVVSKEYKENDVIPAGEAVVISATAGNYTFKAADATAEKDNDNMLLGTDEEKAIADDANSYFYKLSLDNNGKNAGFYWGAENGVAFTNGAHKAYLKVSKNQANGAKFFSLGGNGETTGIDAIESEKANANAPIFNLSGQRVDNSYKGIVIKNGKKFMKK